MLKQCLLLLLASTLNLHKTAADNCPCGYILNSTQWGGSTIFTNKILTDFTNPKPSLTWSDDPDFDWQAQAYNVSASSARGPYGKLAQTDNVLLSGSAGLDLYVRSQTVDGMVPTAEVVTSRTDILHGSFRIGMQTPATNGTCAAFFFYHDDSQEIDIEILSAQQYSPTNPGKHPVNLVLQSPASVSAGYNAADTPDFTRCNLTFDPTAAVHEYQFDWLGDRIDMFADGHWLNSFYDNLPSQAGAIHMIHWSNGDPGWSAGPPITDAVMRVTYAELFFNTSQNTLPTWCEAKNFCPIPALPGPPDTAAGGVGGAAAPTAKSESGRAVGDSHGLEYWVVGWCITIVMSRL
ncbi:hypothetical protein LTR78_000637 [Recurvomyces mirabilis]|uniref:GH16 domain-containing protein n=1 Tax=Recurvomyces mirabilis TaxID=574656 RepID=A0AAE0WY83_9PEZI|nr:hypothetical protein LTR78_000637 [Recurvomyces mirabilis]KAK5162291.1 hypothetical protein LTS14_000638 [Recurvomyces mirabilis]